MRVYVELPPGWGPAQIIITTWAQAGYRVDEVRSLGTGERRMIVHGAFPRDRGVRGRATNPPILSDDHEP